MHNSDIKFRIQKGPDILRFWSWYLLKQESCAIAKMTAQCALYMGAWKLSGLSDYAHGYYSQYFFTGFCSSQPCEFSYKIWSPYLTRSLDNRGYQKNWTVPGYVHASFTPKFVMGFYLNWPQMYPPNLKFVALSVPEIRGGLQLSCKPPISRKGGHRGSEMVPFERVLVSSYKSSMYTYYSSISTCLPEILDCSFQWGLRTHNLGEGEFVEGRDGTVRKSVGEFL